MSLDNNELEVVESTKLLGVMCSSTGKWNEHIQNLTKKANTRLYFVRQLKGLGAPIETLKETYVLEMCAPLWTGALYLRSEKLSQKVWKQFSEIFVS